MKLHQKITWVIMTVPSTWFSDSDRKTITSSTRCQSNSVRIKTMFCEQQRWSK